MLKIKSFFKNILNWTKNNKIATIIIILLLITPGSNSQTEENKKIAIDKYINECEAKKHTLQNLENQIKEKEDILLDIEEKINKSNNELNSLKNEPISNIKEKNIITADVKEISTTSATNNTSNSKTVYVGATGSKYHKASCRTLKNGGREISLDEAKAEERTACGICGG